MESVIRTAQALLSRYEAEIAHIRKCRTRQHDICDRYFSEDNPHGFGQDAEYRSLSNVIFAHEDSILDEARKLPITEAMLFRDKFPPGVGRAYYSDWIKQNGGQ